MSILDFEFIQRGDLLVFIIIKQDNEITNQCSNDGGMRFISTNGFNVISNKSVRVWNNEIYLKGCNDIAYPVGYDSTIFASKREASNYKEKAEFALNEFIKNGGFTKPKPKTVWNLEDGDEYWALNADGSISQNNVDCEYDIDCREQGNAFLSKSEAKKEDARRKAETKLVRLIAEFNDGWVPDWSKGSGYKFYLRVNFDRSCVVTDFTQLKSCHDKFYLKSNDIPITLHDEMRRLFKISIGVEE